ncbi:hypothetical protein QCA50_013782 [Cerrena zonata]|uniref:Protein kinase domain-containing protein n=1 Tax=Cerrena zonata TaxID=2478898 RepID=A0AAW0FY43_9APHY
MSEDSEFIIRNPVINDMIMEGLRMTKRHAPSMLDKLEARTLQFQGERDGGFGLRSLSSMVLNESRNFLDIVFKPEFREDIRKRTDEFVKQLALTDENGIPLTAHIWEFEDPAHPDRGQIAGPEPLPHVSDSVFQAIIPFVTRFNEIVPDVGTPSAPEIASAVTNLHAFLAQSSSSSATSAATQILEAIFEATTSIAEKVLAEQESLPTKQDAQVVVDVLHEHMLHMIGYKRSLHVKLRMIDILKRLCVSNDILPRKLFLSDVQCDITEGPKEQGSYGDVYQGYYQGEPVALKFLRIFQSASEYRRAKIKKNFCREVLIWSYSSSHPYVLPILGINNTCFKHGMCMVLPWMKNGTLNHFIERLQVEGRFEDGQDRVGTWIYQIAQGLDSLHDEEIIHGDLRAGNVLIDNEYNARVSDFGLAITAKAYVSQTSTGGPANNWLAPELVSSTSPSPPTKPSDVYAFGCLCIEVYTGEPPYGNIALGTLLRRISNGIKPPRPHFYGGKLMSDQLWSLVDSCLSFLPGDRPTASRLASEL